MREAQGRGVRQRGIHGSAFCAGFLRQLCSEARSLSTSCPPRLGTAWLQPPQPALCKRGAPSCIAAFHPLLSAPFPSSAGTGLCLLIKDLPEVTLTEPTDTPHSTAVPSLGPLAVGHWAGGPLLARHSEVMIRTERHVCEKLQPHETGAHEPSLQAEEEAKGPTCG